MGNSIYYYISNYVLIKLLITEHLWIKISTSLNDTLDTTYAMKYFENLKEDYEYQDKVLENVKEILEISKYINMQRYKEII